MASNISIGKSWGRVECPLEPASGLMPFCDKASSYLACKEE
jgi:hypothetical protein